MAQVYGTTRRSSSMADIAMLLLCALWSSVLRYLVPDECGDDNLLLVSVGFSDAFGDSGGDDFTGNHDAYSCQTSYENEKPRSATTGEKSQGVEVLGAAGCGDVGGGASGGHVKILFDQEESGYGEGWGPQQENRFTRRLARKAGSDGSIAWVPESITRRFLILSLACERQAESMNRRSLHEGAIGYEFDVVRWRRLAAFATQRAFEGAVRSSLITTEQAEGLNPLAAPAPDTATTGPGFLVSSRAGSC